MRTIAVVGLALWSTAAVAEKRIMTDPAFGCPTAMETSSVLRMRREGLAADGHVTPDADRASRAFMAEHKCRFFKKGDLVEFEWSNMQRLEPESLGHAVCIRGPTTDECAYAPKNFSEARSSAVQEERPKEPPQQTAQAPQTSPTTASAPQAPSTAAPEPFAPAPIVKRRPRTSNRIEISPL